VAVLVEILSMYTNPGDRVLDPFCGTGSCGVACLLYGRTFVGIERDGNIVPHSTQWLSDVERTIQDRGPFAVARRFDLLCSFKLIF